MKSPFAHPEPVKVATQRDALDEAIERAHEIEEAERISAAACDAALAEKRASRTTAWAWAA